MPITEAQRASTLERFHQHRKAWDSNPALRTLYADWYGRIAAELPPPSLGPRIELGSGPGFARQFIPDLELSDIVRAPWHDRECSADALPFADGSVGAVVLFDVLHHLTSPRTFFAEAIRVLRPGGRLVMCEPYVSPVSYPVYKFLHEEPTILRGVDPLADQVSEDPRDPFDSNQAIPTLLFGRRRAELEAAFPPLAILRVDHLSSISYPASGGFSHRSFLPMPLWSALHRLESKLPRPLLRWAAFRILVTMERRA
jgi:SAM-dependent methyltransferase